MQKFFSTGGSSAERLDVPEAEMSCGNVLPRGDGPAPTRQVSELATQVKTSFMVQAKRMSTLCKLKQVLGIFGILILSICLYGRGGSIISGISTIFWHCVTFVSHIMLDAARMFAQLLAALVPRAVGYALELLVFVIRVTTNATSTITSATAFSFDTVCFFAANLNSEMVGFFIGGCIILTLGMSCYTARAEPMKIRSRTRSRQIVR